MSPHKKGTKKKKRLFVFVCVTWGDDPLGLHPNAESKAPKMLKMRAPKLLSNIHQAVPFFGALILLFRRSCFGSLDQLCYLLNQLLWLCVLMQATVRSLPVAEKLNDLDGSLILRHLQIFKIFIFL